MATEISSSGSLGTKKHEVFINFRSEDTRANFTSYLLDALKRSSIETYKDYKIKKGKQMWGELKGAILNSNLFLVVLSENYASSTWCLDELVEIMNCSKNGQVIPVFYYVDPSHVRKQTESYHKALERHKKNHGKEMIQKWKDALSQVANLSGFDSSTYKTETELIKDIITAVLEKLNHKKTNEFMGQFIADQNFSHIESLMNSREVKIIGIWGMGGIGKTTLADAVFQKLSSKYEGSCFLRNMREESKRQGLNNMCTKLFSELLSEEVKIHNFKVIPTWVLNRLKDMKVLIVLDDLHTLELLENLTGEGCKVLGDGSKVIVTSRDKQVLVSGGVGVIHQVKEMNSQNSLRLLSLNAFNKVLLKEGYEEVSRKAIDYANGIPLVLTVLGKFLRSKSEKEWDSALNKLKVVPYSGIQEVLKLSYDELDDTEKDIFLDIACFFKGFKRDQVTKILNACDFFAETGIRNLLDKSLITISSDETIESIQMHDLIQEMGKEIVRQESIKFPGERSRLCNPKEVYDVLTKNEGTRKVEGIWLDMDQISQMNLSSKVFENMPNLRVLAFQDVKKTKSVCLPNGLDLTHIELKYLRWDGYPSKSLPSSFCLEKLVVLSLEYSNLEKLWDGVPSLPNLEELNLYACKDLIESPNLSGAPNFRDISLHFCERLTLVDRSIITLPKIESIKMLMCPSLHKVLPSPAFLALEYSIFYSCETLSEIPGNICLLTSLQSSELSQCSFIRFPQSTKDLPLLIRIVVVGRKMLPFVSPPSFQDFHVQDRKSLSIISSSMGRQSGIFKFDTILFQCIKLDPHSHHTIMEDAIVKIELGAKLQTSISKNKKDDVIWYLLPTLSNKFQKFKDWFDYRSSQVSLRIELPSNLLGFICYMTLSQGRIDHGGSIGCECNFKTSLGDRTNKTSFILHEFNLSDAANGSLNIMSDHVVLWYDAEYCKQIIDAVKYNPNVRFRFFIETTHDPVKIKQCGFRWIYNSEDQTDVEEEGLSETKTSCEIHELESSIVQNRAEGFEFDHVTKKYEVFISFRGEDTRANFTSHLHDALKRSSIQTYIDYKIKKGKQVWGELEEAIRDSNLFLVVLSENYASSTWCLDELVEIMNCSKNGQVIPIFYNVDPSHVKKLIGSYQTALATHKKNHGKEMIQKWKYALSQVAKLSGFHSSTYEIEIELIEAIIKAVLEKLNHKNTNELRGLSKIFHTLSLMRKKKQVLQK